MSGYGYSGYNAPPPGGYPPQQNAYPPSNPGGSYIPKQSYQIALVPIYWI
jgi:hypothetical protein